MKFGGESLRSADEIAKAMGLVRKNSGNGMAVVVSALAGVTDKLERLAGRALSGEAPEDIQDDLRLIEDMHVFEAQRVIKDNTLLLRVIEELKTISLELEHVLVGVCYINEITPRTKDRILSAGERLCAPLISGALQSMGLKSTHLTGWDIGIVTDGNFTRANPLREVSLKNISSVLVPLFEKDIVPVITGFIAKDEQGNMTTLGRGGSDLTASLIGAAIGCDEIWLCKSIDGIMTADPSLVPDARLLENISYAEAAEMAYFGAKVLHPLCIEPALENGIPVRVRNSFRHDIKGTLVVQNNASGNDVVKTVSVLDKIGLVNVSGMNMRGMPSIVTDIFKVLADGNIPVLMISQGSSEANLTMVVASEHAGPALELLKKEFVEGRHFRSVCLDDTKCIIAVVGAGMLSSQGVAARIFSAISSKDVNMTMISSGSNEINISFAIDRSDVRKAVCAVHDEFGLGRQA